MDARGAAVAATVMLLSAPAARAASGAGATQPSQQPGAPAISVRATPSSVSSEQHVRLAGGAPGAPAGSVVDLYKSPYPYPAARLVAATATNPDGSFAFRVFPDRDTRYRVLLPGTTATALVQIEVGGRTITNVQALQLGRARVTSSSSTHETCCGATRRCSWSFDPAAAASPPRTRTVRLSPYVAVLGATVALPAGRFEWQACFHAPGDQALANPRRPPGCTGRGYHGGGSCRPGTRKRRRSPGRSATSRAEEGARALAVIDSEGRLSGVNVNGQFITGSVVKAMLLVAYLRRLDADGQHYVDSNSNSFLYPMIHVSDNNAATECWSIVGDSGLYAVARGRRDDPLLGLRHLGHRAAEAADQAQVLLRDGLADPTRVRRVRPLPALDDRRLRELGDPG